MSRSIMRISIPVLAFLFLGCVPAGSQESSPRKDDLTPEEIELFLSGGTREAQTAIEDREDTPLILAVKARDLARVQRLLEGGVAVNEPGRFGRTALMAALHETLPAPPGRMTFLRVLLGAGADPAQTDAVGNSALFFLPSPESVELLELLLSRGAPVDVPNRAGTTPLFTAAFRGHRKTVELLLEKGAEPDRRSAAGRTPFAEAVLNGHLDIADLLAKRKAHLNPVFNRGLTLLHTAAELGKAGSVSYLIRQGVDVDAPVAETSARRGDTPLAGSARKGHAEVVDVLLRAGAAPDRIAGRAMTPLQEAVHGGHLEVVSRLLEAGADVEATGREKNRSGPLVLAAMRGHVEIARRLLQAGADANAANRRKVTALMFSSFHGHAEIAKLLLAKGAKVDRRSRDGNTALIYAVVRNQLEAVSLLLENKADPDEEFELRDWGFVTPVLLAAGRGRVEMTRKLIESGAPVEIFCDVDGMGHVTPLMVAAARGSTGAVRVLLDAGASPTTVDDEGRRALDWATRFGRTDVVELLRSRE